MSLTVYTRDGQEKRSEPGFAPQSIVAKLLRFNADQGITNGTWTKATFNTVAFDPYGITDAANHRLVIKTPGYYNVQAHMAWTGSGQANSRWGDLRHYNSSGVQKTNRIDNRIAAVAGGTQHSAAFSPIYCAAGDYFELWVYNDNSQNLTNLTAMEAYMVGASVGVASEPWTPVTSLLNGWTDYQPGPNTGVAYMKDTAGFVHLRGEVGAGTWTAGTAIFTLPQGYRPGSRSFPPVYMNASPFIGVLSIQTNGNVQVEQRAGTATHIHGLAHISFRAEQ